MTKEEATKILRKSIDNSVEMTIREWEEFDKEFAEAIDMAIKALQEDEVLCKDCANCIHYDDETENEWLWCTIYARSTAEEDSCSFAERKEE